MHSIRKRLSSLKYLARPLALAFLGIVVLSLGVAYFFILIYRTAELPAGQRYNIKQNISHDERLAQRHVTNIFLSDGSGDNGIPPLSVTRLTLDALTGADAIILGPGSLFESVLPDLLIPELRETIRRSKAR